MVKGCLRRFFGPSWSHHGKSGIPARPISETYQRSLVPVPCLPGVIISVCVAETIPALFDLGGLLERTMHRLRTGGHDARLPCSYSPNKPPSLCPVFVSTSSRRCLREFGQAFPSPRRFASRGGLLLTCNSRPLHIVSPKSVRSLCGA